ncbi:hypothetical protein HQ544_02795 [Candidatus Falkowbacteria bacterium]|nr:hypothetical protein [Candidatus Falkowbacteria bacterium]
MSLFKKNPTNSHLIKSGILAGVLEAIYITVLIALGTTASSIFRDQFVDNQILNPILFLLIFVFSAAISTLIVLGYPAYLLHVEKKAREAMKTLMITLITLLVLGLIVFGLMVV